MAIFGGDGVVEREQKRCVAVEQIVPRLAEATVRLAVGGSGRGGGHCVGKCTFTVLATRLLLLLLLLLGVGLQAQQVKLVDRGWWREFAGLWLKIVRTAL